MKTILLALILLLVPACERGPNPVAISQTYGCYSDYSGRQICQATFADGDTGFLIRDYYQNAAYACRRGGL